jgi:hypothetical protein
MNPRIHQIKEIRKKVLGIEGDKIGGISENGKNGPQPDPPKDPGWTGDNVIAGTGHGSEVDSDQYRQTY